VTDQPPIDDYPGPWQNARRKDDLDYLPQDERDIAAMAGSRVYRLLGIYRRYRAGRMVFNGAAFFFPLLWLFYRRLWEVGLLYLLGASTYLQGLSYIEDHWPGAFTGILGSVAQGVPSLVAGLWAYPWLFRRVRHLQQQANEQGLQGEDRAAFFRAQGRGSSLGLLAGIAVTAGLVWLALLTANNPSLFD
jgi:hypothetical protein